MANLIKLFLNHGSARHEIVIDPTREILHLMEKLEEITEIPKENMKVIGNGKTVSGKPELSIQDSGLVQHFQILISNSRNVNLLRG